MSPYDRSYRATACVGRTADGTRFHNTLVLGASLLVATDTLIADAPHSKEIYHLSGSDGYSREIAIKDYKDHVTGQRDLLFVTMVFPRVSPFAKYTLRVRMGSKTTTIVENVPFEELYDFAEDLEPELITEW